MILIINQTIGPLFEDIIIEIKKQHKVYLFKGIKYNRNTIFKRLYTWILYSFQLGIHLLFFGHKYNKILVVTNPPFAPIFVAFRGKNFSILIYDIYPQILSEYKLPKIILNPITSIWHKLNKYTYDKSNFIFTLSKGMAKELEFYFDNKKEWEKKVKVIPPWINSKIEKINETNLEDKSNFSNKELILTYAGNIGLTHPIEFFLYASKSLEGLIKIFIIGKGPKKQKLLNISEKIKTNNKTVFFLDPVNLKKLIFYSRISDLAIVALDENSSNFSLPSKAFTALATGTPILCLASKNSSISELIKEYECGFIIEPNKDSIKKIVSLIKKIKANPELLEIRKENAIKASKLFTQKNAKSLVYLFINK